MLSSPILEAQETSTAPSPLNLDAGVPLNVGSALTVYTVEELRQLLSTKMADSPGLILDLGEVSDCDCAGLQLLCAARKSARMLSKYFQVINCSPAILAGAEAIGLKQEEFAGTITRPL